MRHTRWGRLREAECLFSLRRFRQQPRQERKGEMVKYKVEDNREYQRQEANRSYVKF